MAATTPRITAFWGAFLNVLIRCIAALGFATPASMKAAASRPASLPAAGSATVPAQAYAPAAIGAAAPVEAYSAPPLLAGRILLPAPRSSERGRSLPPTMKQRIRAEAHGTSPSSRSIAVPVDGLGEAVAAAAAAAGATDEGAAADRVARRRDRALCG
ncbi:DUF6344 domain-containing protein [Actinacidiphila bryophytorum]|uniref:Uncharacterized protein n=1 Tax=Actinacidiphila bryophytorum TaxID=1436133 RepID=A0A9W4MJK8_9ACTN|nr:DUF6344 domain-containing protein [Actinacidiphila bryophytorum]CAG7651354.1 conserved exported hypothetical protein [Actinacidiphila bryophytorum]